MNTTRDMAEGQDNKGGHESELGNASTRMAQAIVAADPEALRKAASDHAAALGSQATAMAASIAAPVYGRLGDISAALQELALIVTNARQADLGWRTDERLKRDAQSTRLYDELDKLEAGQAGILAVSEETATGLKKLSTQVGEMGSALAATIGRVSNVEEAVNEHTVTLAAHERAIHDTRTEVESLRASIRTIEQKIVALDRQQLLIRQMLANNPPPPALKKSNDAH
jgi:chromosome segregation ATPase